VRRMWDEQKTCLLGGPGQDRRGRKWWRFGVGQTRCVSRRRGRAGRKVIISSATTARHSMHTARHARIPPRYRRRTNVNHGGR